jgi:hypothetical protein
MGSFQVNCFFINNIKIHSFTSLTGVGALQGNFGTVTGVQLKLRKHPNAYIAIEYFTGPTIFFRASQRLSLISGTVCLFVTLAKCSGI